MPLSEGTGGTIAGTGQFLKSMADDILVVLADPEGSGLYNKVSRVAVPILY
jgi:cysteine synthase A